MQPLQSSKIIHLLRNLSSHLDDRWKRKRKQSPQTIFLTLMLMALSRSPISTRRALTLLSEIFPHSCTRREPSPAAFCKMRFRLSDDQMRDVFHRIDKETVPKNSNDLTINGYKLVAIDGSQIITPNSDSTRIDFGHYKSKHHSHSPQSRLIAAWDVSTRRPLHWQVGTCHESERAAAVNMISFIPNKSIVLLDRGFFGVQTLRAFKDSETPCFMRIRQGRSTWLEAQTFLKSKKRDDIIQIQETHGASMSCRIIKRRIYSKRKRKYVTYAFITTLMDKKRWPAKTLVDAYRLRWDIETAFREMKIQDQLETFRGKSSHAVRQEIAAYMIARLLTSLVTCQLHRYQSQARDISSMIKMTCNHITIMDTLYDCFMKIINGEMEIAENMCLHRLSVALSAMQNKRDGRIYPFKCKGRYGRWKGTKNYRQNYKS